MLSMIMVLVVGSHPDIETYLSDYFVTYRNEVGLVQDRATTPDIFSVAATGFGFDVLAIKVQKGEISRSVAIESINRSLDFMEEVTPKKNRGWFYHFINKEGSPQLNCEVSTIDTAIYFWGARQASRRLGDLSLRVKVESAISRVDVNWMSSNSSSGKRIPHGLNWKEDIPQFLPCEWDKNSEGILIYRLFKVPYEFVYDDFSLPLFVYYFPMCFLPQAEFQPFLKAAVDHQVSQFGCLGITSTDTAEGYCFYPKENLSPLALYAISPFDTRAARELERLRLSPKVHSSHRFSKWVSSDRIGIDEGAAVILRHPLPAE